MKINVYNIRWKMMIIFLVLLPLIILFRFWFQRYWQVRQALQQVTQGKSIAAQVSSMQHSSAVTLWKNLPYSPISSSSAFYNEWSRLPANFETVITPSQHNQLLKDAQIILLMNASKDTSRQFSSYVAARHGISRLSSSDLRSIAMQAKMPVQSDPLVISTAVINHFVDVPQLKGICIPASNVTYDEVSMNRSPYRSEFDGASIFGNNSSLNFSHRMFRFGEDFEGAYQQGKAVKIAKLTLYVNGVNDKAGPIALWMWWSSVVREWQPLRMVSGADDQWKLFLP